MDASQTRPSAIPRPSRLPVARPVSGIPRPASSLPGPSASADSLAAAATRELQPPKLRHASSRGRLRTSTSTALQPSSSRDQLRSSLTQSSSSASGTRNQPAAVKPGTSRGVSQPQRRSLAPDAARHHPIPVFDAHLQVSGHDAEGLADDDVLGNLPPDVPSYATTPKGLRSRPSLAERTIETLSLLPSSPAMAKRPSSFYDQSRPGSRGESAHSRPGSSYNSDGSAPSSSKPDSRPGSSGGLDEPSTSIMRPPANTLQSSASAMNRTPQRRSDFAHAATPKSGAPLRRTSTVSPSKLTPSAGLSWSEAKCSGSARKMYGKSPPKSGARTLAEKPVTPRAPVRGLFRKPSLPSMGRPAVRSGRASPNPAQEPAAAAAAWDGAIPPIPSAGAGSGLAGTGAALKSRKSSAALREQIAKAKAAKRAAVRQVSDGRTTPSSNAALDISPDDGFGFVADHDDPFNLRRGENAGVKVLKQRAAAARTSGRLNIAALGLKQIPAEVMKMYDLENIGTTDGSWAESVDLTRLVAADNELETLDDAVFPDLGSDALDGDEDCQGNIFGGLETLDLHGNVLISVPLGFRRLVHLTSLNLSSNQLGNDCLDVISQMTALRDLKLSKNRLSGPLNPVLCDLTSLEILDVHGNGISALPEDLESMSRLRILNLSENELGSLPFDGLARLPLTELLLRKNKLSGTLIREPIHSLPLLQTLDASSNQLTHLVAPGSAVGLPVVNAVSLSMNRLQELPDLTAWTNLVTLTVDENSISSIPHSFTGLEKLRHADFSSNDIRVVPPEIARMGSLATLRLTGNPLRDKKFASATTDELKEVLAGRLEPPPPYQEPGDARTVTDLMGQLVEMDTKFKTSRGPPTAVGNAEGGDSRSDAEDDFATPPTSAPHSPSHTPSSSAHGARSRSGTVATETWLVKPGGLLDRSRTAASALDRAMCLVVAGQYQVRQAQLHHNLFTRIPDSLGTFSATLVSLSLSHNQLGGDSFLAEELELPVLREINLASNLIADLGPLTAFLRAPVLDKMDVSMNRIRRLPGALRQAFPRLTVLLASNNQLTELEPESIKGLRTVDASSNDITQLNPRIGLLGGQGGLQRLEVTGNRFKVPRWGILEQGTEATLRWLRGRVPAAEMASWREKNGGDGDDDVD
ncbi:hypothetical protein CDD83_5393 [Cordyceps sp. RAO-2017]|nr:hypothetical protein CDD83_5393 [Cordyceps sp. RAO-2017]